MNEQPFDYYKDDVEYNYILSAKVSVGIIDNIMPNIINLIKDEDFLKIYFPNVALGRVYAKVEYLNENLYFLFGISLIDSNINTEEIISDINDFILALNKNIENIDLKIEEGDIVVDIIKGDNSYLDNIDKILVNESNIYFKRNNDIQQFSLASDGTVEKYNNGYLYDSVPFSKLGILRESKQLLSNGYTLTLNCWPEYLKENIITQDNNDNNDNTNAILNNPDEIKRDLKNNIQDVEEIQDLKDELEDKLATLNESDNTEKYILVIYTNINGNFVPDVCVQFINGDRYSIADNIDEAGRYQKDEADNYVDEYNKIDAIKDKHILKAVKEQDINSIKGLYESKQLNEDNEDTITDLFPSTQDTEIVLNYNQLSSLDLKDILNDEQINWLENNIGTLYEIINNLKDFIETVGSVDDEEVISLDDYFNQLNDIVKGE